MERKIYVGRLAPSPTGALHLGNARTFLLAWLRCRSRGGRLLLRLEDLDHPRVKPDRVGQVYEDLRWLGLDWDEGPPASTPLRGGAAGYVQSERAAFYREAFEKLRAEGLVYPCYCTRADVEAAQSAPHEGEELRYPGTCRPRADAIPQSPRAAARPAAWRFLTGDGESVFIDAFYGKQSGRLCDWSGDFVIGKSAVSYGPEPAEEFAAAYQLAVVADDHAMGVTEVVRAEDLLASTHRQLALYAALGWQAPEFLHAPLVVGADGKRLAKRHGDTRLAALRAAGTPPQRVVGWLAQTCGWARAGEELIPAELLPRFDLQAVPRRRVTVDAAALRALGLPPQL